MLVQFKSSDDGHVLLDHPNTRAARAGAHIRAVAERLPLLVYHQHDRAEFSPHWMPDNVPARLRHDPADILHLHWVSTGYLSVESIGRLERPVVWTLHDMWPFTGGCHYSGECTAYRHNCGSCPELDSSSTWDLSRWVWQRKSTHWQKLDLTVVCPTRWMAERARASSLFADRPVRVIPLGIDTTVYRPIDAVTARHVLGLPLDKKLVLFGALGGAENERKGRDLLEAALSQVASTAIARDLQLVVFGSSSGTGETPLRAMTRHLGHLHDDVALALAYSAADVMIVPSREDNFPLTALEALACGTPVVGFDTTGLVDMVDHLRTGYLAHSFDVRDLLNGILWVLEDDARRRHLGRVARTKVEADFSIARVAEAYTKLYYEALGTRSANAAHGQRR
jgi:glycosyltransferase involved in cell wall biosynthesis